MPPPVLLASIERLGLRRRFTQWLLLTACRIVRQLAASGINVPLSINLSANDLLDVELPALIRQSLDVWHVSTASLQIEITETSMLQETDTAFSVLKTLREQEVVLSVDDFGTAYSSLSNLKNLPVREIKIDQSFIRNLTQSRTDLTIVQSMIALAHQLGLHVVAEGVETAKTASQLSALDCDRLQGFLFSPALPLETFVAWFESHQAETSQDPS